MKKSPFKKFPSSIIALSLLVQAEAQANVEVMVKSGDPSPAMDRFLYFARQNNNHHRPSSFMSMVRRDFGERGIQFTTSINPNDLNLENLNQFDGIFFFGNHGTFTTTQTDALEAYVGNGGGMVGMHVISFVARSNAKLARILGGAFRGHHAISAFTSPLIQSPEDYPANLANHPNFPFEAGDTYLSEPDHPILDGLLPYTSADEPYLHQNLNPDLILLGYREDHGNWDEPYTWVRHEGNGRVFYHANGHDARTWNQPNFKELMIRGTSWVSRPQTQSHRTLFPPSLSPQGALQYMSEVETSGGMQSTIQTHGQVTAMQGMQVPGDDESLKYRLTETSGYAMLGDDQIVLTTKIQSAAQEPDALLVGHSRYPQLIALATGSANDLEAGFRFSANQNFPFVTDGQNMLVFSASIEDSAGGNQKKVIAVYQNEVLSPLLIEGDPLDDDPITLVNSLAESPLYCSDSGELAILARLETPSSPLATHFLTGTPENLSSRVATGMTSPDLPAGAVFEELLHPIALQDGDLYFTARISGGSTLPTDDEVIVRTNSLGESTILLREGDLIQDQALSFPTDQSPPIMRGNDLLCVGMIAESPSLISVRPSRPSVVLVSEGQSLAIDGELHTISSLEFSSMMASASQVVLPATLTAPDGLTGISCLLQVGSGTVRPLILEGLQIPTSGENFTVSEINCRPSGPHGDGIAGNQIRVLATSPSGESAIIGIDNIDDLDQDGMSDTIEIAFGGSPENPNFSIPPGYPKIVETPGGSTTLTYWQVASDGPPLEYTIEESEDLVSWSPITLETSASPDQSGVASDYKKMMATIPTAGAGRFFRFTF